MPVSRSRPSLSSSLRYSTINRMISLPLLVLNSTTKSLPFQDSLLARQGGWAPYSISIEDGITCLLVKYRRKEKTTIYVLKFDASPYTKEQQYSAPSFSHSNSEVEKGTEAVLRWRRRIKRLKKKGEGRRLYGSSWLRM